MFKEKNKNMKAKNHQISNNNKNIVYVINNVPTQKRRTTRKIQASKSMNNSLPPEQGYRAPDNRFLNSSNLNTEMQRTQLDLINPRLRGKESEIEQRIFNIQNSLKEENETLKKMNNLYSRFDNTPRFEDSINNIYGLNDNDNQGAFGETQGSDNFINGGNDDDISDITSASNIFNNLSSDNSRFTLAPNRLFTPSIINDNYISPDNDTVMNTENEIAQSPSQILSPSFLNAFKSMKLEDTPPERPFTVNTPMSISNTIVPSKTSKLEDTPQPRNFPQPNTPMRNLIHQKNALFLA